MEGDIEPMNEMQPNIIWLESVDSTNNEAKRRIDGLSDMSVIAAYEQTAGRGQREKIWLSDPGKNLTASIILKGEGPILNRVKPENQFVISEMISKTMVNLLADYGVVARIKWPNDIYVGDKKICGILIEHTLRGLSIIHSIIGIGLNVNQTEFDESLPNPTSLVLETKIDQFDLNELLIRLVDMVKNAEIT